MAKKYDICSGCWNPLAQKLKGKGRAKDREIVFLPAPITEREDEVHCSPLQFLVISCACKDPDLEHELICA